MNQQISESAVTVNDDVNSDVMAKYGITKTFVAQFHCGEYRYSNLSDAIAHAKRTLDTALEIESTTNRG